MGALAFSYGRFHQSLPFGRRCLQLILQTLSTAARARKRHGQNGQ
jgi:hypothetical protein